MGQKVNKIYFRKRKKERNITPKSTEVLKKARSRSEYDAITTEAACAVAFSLAKGMRNLDLAGLDEAFTRAFLCKDRIRKLL